MTISSVQNRVEHTGNGSTTVFTVPFRFLQDSDLVVVLRVDATAVDTVQTLNTQYRVTGEGGASGTVEFFLEDGEPQSGETVVIYNDPPLTQTVDYRSGDAFPAETHEGALDLVTIQQKRTREITTRALLLPDSHTDGDGAYDAKLNKISQVAAPTLTSDAATKNYVDSTVTNTVGPIPSGSTYATATGSTIARTINARWGEVKNVKDYGATGDGSTDDTTAIQAAITAASGGGTVLFPEGEYAVNGVLTTTADNVHIHFQGAKFLVGDTGTAGVLLDETSTGKMGWLFKECSELKITGVAYMVGQGTSGTTSLAGMVFDGCTDSQITASLGFETMALGRFVKNCDRCEFGNVVAKDMDGLQTFQAPPTDKAGSTEVIVSSSYCNFGDIVATENFKPVRYLSTDGVSDASAYCNFGDTTASATSGSAMSSVVAVRDANNCVFGIVSGSGFVSGLLVTQYAGDIDRAVDAIHVEAVVGSYPATGASVDAGVYIYSHSATPVGNISIGRVDMSCAGEFGAFVGSGNLTIGSATIDGGGRPFVALDGTVNIGSMVMGGATTGSAVSIGKNCNFNANYIDVITGRIGGATTAAVKYDTAYGRSDTFIDSNVDVGNNEIALAEHPFWDNYGPVQLTTTGTLPAGLALATNYWVNRVDANTIQFLDGSGGSVITITAAAGGGTHTLTGTVGKISIGHLRYDDNSVGADYLYVYADLVNSAENAYIGDIEGTGSTDQARWASDNFKVRRGQYAGSQVPTSGAYSRGFILYDETPSASGSIGWVCTASGTPGTWKAFGDIAS